MHRLRPVYLLLVMAIVLLPVAIIYLLPNKSKAKLSNYLNKFLAHIFHFTIKVSGVASKNRPVLFVSNHISYADILVLGATLPGCFVSKAEVGNWPILGWIAKLNGTLFIDRKKAAAGKHLEQIEEALFNDNKNLIIFPEGTTGDGRQVLPFKSSLFKIAENLPANKSLTIQPVTISYTHINGLPVQENERKKIAWIGDAEFTPHFMDFVNLGMIRVTVTIHPPVEKWQDRKTLALECQQIVASALGN